LQDEAPPAYEEGAKSDRDDTAGERAEPAWVELQQWRTLITPAFKHVFSRVKLKPVSTFGVPLDPSKWAPESDEEEEAEDEAKDDPAAANESCEGKGIEEAKEAEKEKAGHAKILAPSASSVLALAPAPRNGNDEESEANDRLSSAYSFIDSDAQSTRSSIESADQSDAAAADESDLPPTDLLSLRQAMTLAQGAVTATESKLATGRVALARCKTNVREAIQRTIQQKLDEVEQLRHELASVQ